MTKSLKKKKKQRPVTELSCSLDLKSVIHEHSIYFDKLVELIPARFYLPTGDSDKPWFQGLSKQAKASAKKESKKNIKLARRDRMDPEKSTTTLDLLKQSLENDKEDTNKSTSDVDDFEVEMNPIIIEEENEKSRTFETLHRLQQKIAELRATRKPENSNRAKKRIENREYRETHQKKRKRSDGKEEKKKIIDAELLVAKVEKDASEAAKELSFSHVKLGNDDEEEYGNKKPRKMSKSKELEKAKALEEAKKDPEEGDIIAKKHSLKAAMSRAAGVKIHDDPKLIRQSIHKDKKRQEKNAEKWKERTETKERMRAEKQQKRSGNIAERINEKKARRIAKREKKLMRPGFEGRKKGFITQG